MRLTKGSVLSLTPATGWTAHFFGTGETWAWPILGWAVVVDWTGFEGEDRESRSDEHQTSVEPVLLVDDCYVLTWSEYRRDLADPESVDMRILPADDDPKDVQP